MIFKVNPTINKLETVKSEWNPKEGQLENYLIPGKDTDASLLESGIFGEPLLFIGKQVKTNQNTKADILALDRNGNAVIIELKRTQGKLGVETQALQYLADFSAYQGKRFIKRFENDFAKHFGQNHKHELEDSIRSFLGDDDALVEGINRHSRLILMAQSFHPSLFSMGEWLAEKGVAVRFITYAPVEIGEEQFFSFSIAFDRSSKSLYPLTFQGQGRELGYFWHNIGYAEQNWWDFLKKKNQISVGFENQIGDEGYRILTSYVPGDTIIAYASGHGAVGWALIGADPYKLIKLGDPDDQLNGIHLHRLSVSWKAVAKNLEDGVSASTLRKKFGIFPPLRAAIRMNREKAKKLIEELNKRFHTRSDATQ